MSFIGKSISCFLNSIPTAVLGGILIIFGVIAASGLKILVENKINFDNKKKSLDLQV